MPDGLTIVESHWSIVGEVRRRDLENGFQPVKPRSTHVHYGPKRNAHHQQSSAATIHRSEVIDSISS
jgi:hypothetical protein